MEYRSLMISIVGRNGEFGFKIKKLDGSLLDESAESFNEYQTREDAIDGAKEFIDQWYESE
jgi:hypothetical protein